MAWLIKARATMFIEERPGFIYLGEDTLVIPRILDSDWKGFIKRVNELYKEETAKQNDNGIGDDIVTLE